MPKTKATAEEKKVASKTKTMAKPVSEQNAVATTVKAPKKRAAKTAREKSATEKTTHKKSAKAHEHDQEVATARPAAPSRPSMYEDIANAAKKREDERAAKAAALKASASSQSAASKPTASSTPTVKRPTLNVSFSRPISAAPKAASESRQPTTPRAASSSKPSETASTATALKSTVIAPPVSTSAEAPTAAETHPPVRAEAKKTVTKEIETSQSTPSTSVTTTAPATKPVSTQPVAMAKPSAGASSTAAPPVAAPKTATVVATPRGTPPVATPKTAVPTTPPSAAPKPEQRVAVKAPLMPAPEPVVTKLVPPAAPAAPSGPIAMPAIISVRELAPLLSTTPGDMIKKLMSMGIFATINQAVDYDTASLIAEEFGFETKPAASETPKVETPATTLRTAIQEADQSKLQPRPPVVTVLGHVDHGKTTLLDAIRHTQVAAGEAGGITQHIGAYQVEPQGRKLTFLDTPGHEAFTAMRARGAQVTDVAVLVVAADDGVMPQTREAINHARAANVPIVVALNKMDRETADPAKAMRQLADAGVVVEEWGGDVPMVKVSAKKLMGIEELLEMVLLVADLAELKANPNVPALGTVIEAQLDRNRGPVATLLVQNGTLRQNDYLVVHNIQGRIRAMFNDRGERLGEAGPSMPVVVLGLPSVPQAGSTFQVVADERTARTMAGQAAEATPTQATARPVKAMSLDDLYAQMQAGKVHELNIILKADVQGSLEPIRNSLEKLSSESLKVRIIHEGIGQITESDSSLALASDAIIIGFNVEPDAAAKRLASAEGVDVRQYNVIYRLIEDVEKALQGLLEPTYKEVVSGRAEVRQVFKVSKKAVAGCYVLEGKATRSGQARVLRAGKAIYDGRVAGLKRFTEDVREVFTGFECGVMLEGFDDVKQGDVIEFYHKEQIV